MQTTSNNMITISEIRNDTTLDMSQLYGNEASPPTNKLKSKNINKRSKKEKKRQADIKTNKDSNNSQNNTEVFEKVDHNLSFDEYLESRNQKEFKQVGIGSRKQPTQGNKIKGKRTNVL